MSAVLEVAAWVTLALVWLVLCYVLSELAEIRKTLERIELHPPIGEVNVAQHFAGDPPPAEPHLRPVD